MCACVCVCLLIFRLRLLVHCYYFIIFLIIAVVISTIAFGSCIVFVIIVSHKDKFILSEQRQFVFNAFTCSKAASLVCPIYFAECACA